MNSWFFLTSVLGVVPAYHTATVVRSSPVMPSTTGSMTVAQALGTTGGEDTGGEVDFAERATQGKFSFDFARAEILDIVKAISVPSNASPGPDRD